MSMVRLHAYVTLCVLCFTIQGNICDTTARTNHGDLSVHVTRNAGYDVLVNNEIWLSGLPPYLTTSRRRFSAADGSLQVTGHGTRNGTDLHGNWKAMDTEYSAGGVVFRSSVKIYSTTPMIIFEQYYPDGAPHTSVGSPDAALSGFPRFLVGGQTTGVDLGYLNYGGMFAGDTTKWMGRWTKHTYNIRDGVPGGPIALFDKTGRVLVISSFNNFMVAVSEHESILGGVLSYGIMGTVKTVPRSFRLQTVVYFGQSGINEAFEGWGATLRKEYGRDNSYVKSDLAINYLGYWTDNGAYYYYQTENNTTYDETIFEVQKYANEIGIPYRYVQYDSWWYSMGPAGGVTKWEGQKTIFPRGMQYVYNKTGWPVVAHNRWWSSATPYSKTRGGRFHFLVEKLKSVPMDLDFWDWLFKESKLWGLITYEQDWLDAQLLGLDGLLSDVESARTWLVLMGRGAARAGITLQYCMSFPRHVLQALEIPQVTQVRVSDDYAPGKDDWRIGISSIFAHAMRIASYKDSFWTTTIQPGNPYGLNETHPALHAVVSVLSGGPVGPGDKVGLTNVSLLMRCCNKDGLILKPDKPVTAVDAQMMEAAFRDESGPRGEVWSTHSRVSGLVFGIILAAYFRSEQSFDIRPSTAGLAKLINESRVRADNPERPTFAVPFDEQHPLRLQGCSETSFCLYHTTPLLHLRNKELLLYGEIGKWVPMSSKRFTNIDLTSADVTIKIRGAVNETVTFWYLYDHVTKVDCVMSETGLATVSVIKGKCYH